MQYLVKIPMGQVLPLFEKLVVQDMGLDGQGETGQSIPGLSNDELRLQKTVVDGVLVLATMLQQEIVRECARRGMMILYKGMKVEEGILYQVEKVEFEEGNES